MKFSTSLTSIASLVSFISSASAAALPVESTSLATRSSDLAPRTPGWCGVHVRLFTPDRWQFEHQDVKYAVEVTIKNPDGNQIGYLSKTNADLPVSVNSQLPNVLVITSEWDQAGYVQFAYGSDAWKSYDTQCKVGEANSPFLYGTTDMDCGFTCN